jgi:hypothetical protein
MFSIYTKGFPRKTSRKKVFEARKNVLKLHRDNETVFFDGVETSWLEAHALTDGAAIWRPLSA